MGNYLKFSGQIPIDRFGGSKALKEMIKKSHKGLKKQQQIIIFPEGTRTLPGADSTYYPGVYALYKAFPDIPTVPVVLNSGLFWQRNSFIKNSGEITLEFLPPIQEGLNRKNFMKEI